MRPAGVGLRRRSSHISFRFSINWRPPPLYRLQAPPISDLTSERNRTQPNSVFTMCMTFYLDFVYLQFFPLHTTFLKTANYYFWIVDGWFWVIVEQSIITCILKEASTSPPGERISPQLRFSFFGGGGKSMTQGFLIPIRWFTRTLLNRNGFTGVGWLPGFILGLLIIRQNLKCFFSFFLCSLSCCWTIYFGFTWLYDLHHGKL